MFQVKCRPMGRLFYWVLAGVVVIVGGVSVMAQSGPPLTTVADTVYLADGTPAQGTLIITWPEFETAAGTAVAAGLTNVTLGANGALSVALASNAGSSPAGIYYTVVYQLGPGEVKTEYWLVPTTSPATLAQVRTTPGSGIAAQPVSVQYVNTELATKANDNAVVHLAGSETITGTKVFSTPPNVPAPVHTGDVANKSYVDTSVANVGAGNFLSTSGGTVTGPITLPGNPAAPLQAATKQYVDTGLLSKADLLSGVVPSSELGTGTANSGTCLLGNGSWGPCGSGSGSGNVSTAPAASQNIAQPVGTQFGVNNVNGIRYVTLSPSVFNWSQAITATLVGGAQATVAMSTCPPGIFGTDTTTYISINNGAEYAQLQGGGTCVPGASNLTIKFTPANNYTNPTLGSASSGIQEALNDAQSSGSGASKANFRVMFQPTNPPGTSYYAINAAVTVPNGLGDIDGSGASIDCEATDKCFYFTYGELKIHGFRVATKSNSASAAITATSCSNSPAAGTNTITAANNFLAGQWVDIRKTDNGHYWGPHQIKSANSTSFVFLDGNNCAGSTTLAPAVTPGGAALERAFIEDAGNGLTVSDIYFDPPTWGTETLSNGIVVDNDQDFTADNIIYSGNGGVHCDANYCGAAIYAPGPFSTAAALGRISHSQLSMACQGNGIDWLSGNTLKVTDTVIQGFQQYAIETGTFRGGFGGTITDNLYNEVGGCSNPIMTAAGFAGPAAFNMAGVNVIGNLLTSNGGGIGQEPQFATGGATTYEYWMVICDGANCSTPMRFGQAAPANSSPYTIGWPRYASQTGSTVTYWPLRTSGAGYGLAAPYGTGSWSLVSSAVAQCANFMCTMVDSTSTTLQSYTLGISPNLVPSLWNWPGSIVLSAGAIMYGNDLPVTNLSSIVTTSQNAPSVFVQRLGAATPGVYVTGLAGNSVGNNNGAVGATLLQTGVVAGGGTSGTKGRLNFFFGPSGSPSTGHLITLVDSNPFKTWADSNHRPSNDAADTFVGIDQSGGVAQIGLAIGASLSVSNYVGNAGDNANWGERLTAGLKEFKVATKFDSGITFAGITGTGSQCLHVSSTGVLSGTGSDCGSGSGSGSGIVNTGLTSQVALYTASGAAVSGDSGLTDNGTTLNYAGSGGISAATGNFSGNLTVNGQLQVAGPWIVSSPIPGTAMAAASAGTSALGISNDGNFYISANAGTPQKVATTATSSFFSNLFQEDANDLGEYNGTTAQNLHVYSSYTSSSSWQRTSVGYDSTDNYAVLRSESSTSGAAPGLGFWINSGLKWVIDATGNLKPWTDQTFNLGSFTSTGTGSGLRPGTVYVAGNSSSGSGFELGKFANESYELCNDATNGTQANGLAVLTTAGCAAKPGSAATNGIIGVVVANSGTSGIATLARAGSAFCSFDGTATVIGDYVVPSSTASTGFFPLCHDAGSTRPTGTQILGRVLQASAGSTTVQMFMDMPGSNVSSSGSSAGTGSCTNQAVTAVLSGGPTCTTITSSYVDSSIAATGSPALTGTPTAPTATANTNSTQLATTAFVLGQASSTTPNIDGTAAVGTSNTFARADHVHPTDTSRVGGGGSLVSGNYPKANASGTVTDSGVTAGPYSIPWFTTNTTGTAITFSSTAGKAELWGAALMFPMTTTQVTYFVSTADNTANTYDIGVLNSSGNIVAHIGNTAGTTFAASTGWKTVNWTASATLQPGKYYLAITSSCITTCAQLYGGTSAGFTFLGGSSGSAASVTAGGTLNNGITIPADNPTESTIIAWELH